MSRFKILFEINSKNELEINREEVRRIKEYAALLALDKGSKGDIEGRKKYIATKTLYYIYLVYDMRSIYYNLPIEARKEKAIKDAELPSNFKEESDAIKAAIKRYQDDLELTSIGKAYITAEKAYFSLVEDTTYIQEGLNELKELIKTKLKEVQALKQESGNNLTLVSSTAELTALMSKFADTQKTITNNIKLFEDTSKNVKTLLKEFMEEGGDLRSPVGGGVLNPREI